MIEKRVYDADEVDEEMDKLTTCLSALIKVVDALPQHIRSGYRRYVQPELDAAKEVLRKAEQQKNDEEK